MISKNFFMGIMHLVFVHFMFVCPLSAMDKKEKKGMGIRTISKLGLPRRKVASDTRVEESPVIMIDLQSGLTSFEQEAEKMKQKSGQNSMENGADDMNIETSSALMPTEQETTDMAMKIQLKPLGHVTKSPTKETRFNIPDIMINSDSNPESSGSRSSISISPTSPRSPRSLSPKVVTKSGSIAMLKKSSYCSDWVGGVFKGLPLEKQMEIVCNDYCCEDNIPIFFNWAKLNKDSCVLEGIFSNGSIFQAISNKKIGPLERIFSDNNIDINNIDEKGQTLLMFAVECGSVEVVKNLLDCVDIDVNKKNFLGNTALHCAILRLGHETLDDLARCNILKILELFYFDPRINSILLNKNEQYPCHLMAEHYKRYKELIWDWNIRSTIECNLDNYAPAFLFANDINFFHQEKPKRENLERLVWRNFCDSLCPSLDTYKTQSPYSSVKNRLLSNLIDFINRMIKERPPQAFVMQETKNDVKEVRVQPESNMTSSDSTSGSSASPRFSQSGHYRAKKLNKSFHYSDLVEGLFSDLPREKQEATLITHCCFERVCWAILNNKIDLLELFFSEDFIDINEVDEKNQTLLMRAVECRNIEAVKHLLCSGIIDVNEKDFRGNTALHRAILGLGNEMLNNLERYNILEILKLFYFDPRIDSTLKNKNNQTPSDLMKEYSKCNIERVWDWNMRATLENAIHDYFFIVPNITQKSFNEECLESILKEIKENIGQNLTVYKAESPESYIKQRLILRIDEVIKSMIMSRWPVQNLAQSFVQKGSGENTFYDVFRPPEDYYISSLVAFSSFKSNQSFG